jgi:hypothetical protein
MTRVVTRFVFVLAAVTLLSACASTRVPVEESVVGAWTFTVFNTPNGDVTGEFIIAEENGEYTGTITSSVTQGASPIREFVFQDQHITFTTRVQAEGSTLVTKAKLSLAQGEILGIMNIEGVGMYPVKATRKA